MAGLMAAMCAHAQKAPLQLAGVTCQDPPALHCPDTNCPGPMVTEQGSAVEPKTGRRFFLDYPCDLQKGEKVTFLLVLHGYGSYGNWQRNYFPLIDYKDKYRLVIATPNAPTKFWAQADDEYLQNIVELVYEQVGKQNIQAFWLVGHSQGGMTSNRLVRSDFFKNRVDGWLSLSGGRLGGAPGRGDFSNVNMGASAATRAATTPTTAATPTPARPPLTVPTGLPEGNFSFIYETGQHEMDAKGIPESSAWAEKLGCGARVRLPDVTDSKAGYVYDSTRQDPGSDAWGRLPRAGTAEIYEYQKCKDGRVVADVVREDKGHTEGLEPHVTETLVKLMVSAKN